MNKRKINNVAALAVVGALTLAPGSALPHGAKHGDKKRASAARQAEETEFGRAGDSARVTRTIRVGMDDSMHFTPGDIVVKQGATVKFVVRNNGKLMHEMVIGTIKELKEHAELMRKHPGMEHDEPYMPTLRPERAKPSSGNSTSRANSITRA
jgi:plastocyanin